MRKHSLIWIAITFISIFFTGCPNSPQEYQISFKGPYSLYWSTVQKVSYGQTCSRPNDPIVEDNYFLYWAESDTSKKEAKEFDFSTPITSDKTLYAIFTPKLKEQAIRNITSTSIEIAFDTDYELYPFRDGSYPGIKLSVSTDEQNWNEVELTAPNNYDDDSYSFNYYEHYRILSFPLDIYLTEGTNYFKVTNGHETYTKSFIYIKPEKLRTVTFIDCDETLKTVEVSAGDKISIQDIPSNPSKDYNYFMYWSESNESRETAVKFDLETEINKNTTLYAIYTPELSYIYLTNTEINFMVSHNTFNWKEYVYPLADGSYAGIKILYSTDGTNYTQCDLGILEETDYNSNYKLIYKFNEPLSVGTHYFKVTNGHEYFVEYIVIEE